MPCPADCDAPLGARRFHRNNLPRKPGFRLQRPLRDGEPRIAADPHELFPPHQTAAILAGAALGQHEVEFAGIQRLQQRAAQPDGQFEIDSKMNPGEFAQDLGQPALHKILRRAKANRPVASGMTTSGKEPGITCSSGCSSFELRQRYAARRTSRRQRINGGRPRCAAARRGRGPEPGTRWASGSAPPGSILLTP